jgi:hypothetical protein
MSLTVSKESLNELMGLQEDVASVFTQDHLISGQTYWTCVECFAQTKLAELNGEVMYTPNQRF